MPKVPELDWSKLRPSTPETYKQKRKVKTYKAKLVKQRKKKKAKIIDKRLFNDIYDQDQHLRQI